MKIISALPEDAEELLSIYSVYVKETAVTFEYDAPSLEEFRTRIEAVQGKYPYLKAVDDDGAIIGFAFVHHLREREAYKHSVETTIYVKKDCRHSGTGTALYTELERRLREMNITNMYACVAVPKTDDDPYLPDASPRFHKKFGFETCGVFHNCGCKFGRWYDMSWMEKIILPHTENIPDIKKPEA